MMCARAGSRGFPISNAADSKSISSQLQLAYRSDSRLDFAIIRLHYSLSVRVLVWLTIVIRVDNREVSGNWYSVSDDLLEQPEIKPEFLLLLVVVVVLIVRRRAHIGQIHCSHRLWKRRWEAAFHSAADAPSTVRVIVWQLATTHICFTVAADQDRLDLIQIDPLQGRRLPALYSSSTTKKTLFHGAQLGN